MNNLLNMKQCCEATGMSYETLKFYCNEGLVPNVKRAANNYRVFDEHDVNWIRSLSCLKKCGMSIQEMKEYLALCLQGQSTIPERMEQNLDVFDFTLTDEEMKEIAALDIGHSEIIDHTDPRLVQTLHGRKL